MTRSDAPERQHRSAGAPFTASRSRRLLVCLLVLTSLLRLWLGWFFFGFLTGDDVEILETGFRAIGLRYVPWTIRNTLLSDVLAGPLLVAAHGVGVSRASTLIWIASWPFAACATLNIYLLFRLVTQWTSHTAIGLAAAAMYAFHWIPLGFGSMAYPRTVSTTCVLLAALLVTRTPRAGWSEVLAGGAIALACAPRYSEVLFLPAVVLLATHGSTEWREKTVASLRVGLGFATGFLLIAGVYEKVTWGRPFAALIAFARYTLVDRQASSLVAVQPAYWYLWRLPYWWCPATLPFLWIAVRRRQLGFAWVFVVIPIGVLSYVHHKELRYLQGCLPFLCAMSSVGARDLWERGWRRTTVVLFAISLLWGLARLTFLADKTMPSVLAARAMAGDPSIHTVAGVQIWGMGDHLYLGNERATRDIPFPTSAEDLDRLAPGADRVAVYQEDLRKQPELGAALTRLGFCPWREFSFPGSKSMSVFQPCRRAGLGLGARRLGQNSSTL